MSDLSTDIETFLQAASKAGLMNQQGELADQVRRLWSSYDTAINSPCVKPELRLLQVKNDRRMAEHHSSDGFRIDATPGIQPENDTPEAPRSAEPTEIDLSMIDMDLVRVNESTLIQSFNEIHTSNRVMAGRSIFDVVRERQAAFNRSQEQSSASL
jgi:hypothetical protein